MEVQSFPVGSEEEIGTGNTDSTNRKQVLGSSVRVASRGAPVCRCRHDHSVATQAAQGIGPVQWDGHCAVVARHIGCGRLGVGV